MTVEILSVGTELLMGQVANTDAQYLSRLMAELGINVYRHTVVGDNPGRLLEALALAAGRSDGVLLTGGLGPTPDDLTKETLAEFLGLEMVIYPEELAHLESIFAGWHRDMTPNNRKQAAFPAGSTVIPNPNGTAPGCICQQDGVFYAVLPGPPGELRPMAEGFLRKWLLNKSDTRLVSRMLRLFGLGESDLAYRIRDLIENQTNPTIATYAGDGDMLLRVTARAATEEDCRVLLEPVIDELGRRLGEFMFSQRDESLPEVAVRMLAERGSTVAAAESCTGGLLTSLLVGVPGCSEVLIESCVTYTNASKIYRLGVRPETLASHGAVSRETAVEMAEGIRRTSGADWGLATTGIAGPGGGTPDKPVGTVWIALAGEEGCEAWKLSIPRERQIVRRNAALQLLRRLTLAL
ncbi:MAG: competence/damage-inducible protein A [Christensenellales bacterium]|jgi:nicotinamide-nucleotide amidase